jgi:hypothetical protein
MDEDDTYTQPSQVYRLRSYTIVFYIVYDRKRPFTTSYTVVYDRRNARSGILVVSGQIIYVFSLLSFLFFPNSHFLSLSYLFYFISK